MNAPLKRYVGVALDHAALNIDGTPHGIDDADEFHQHPVAGRLDDPTAMLDDFGIDQGLAVGFQLSEAFPPHPTPIKRL